MASKGKESPEMSPEKALALLTEVRNRLSTVAWALHGMHHESEPPGPDDLAAVEQLVSDTVDGPLSEACDALGALLDELQRLLVLSLEEGLARELELVLRIPEVRPDPLRVLDRRLRVRHRKV